MIFDSDYLSFFDLVVGSGFDILGLLVNVVRTYMIFWMAERVIGLVRKISDTKRVEDTDAFKALARRYHAGTEL